MPDERPLYAWHPVDVPSPSTLRGRRHWAVPRSPSVYALYCQGRLVYIGRAVNLRKRLIAHVSSNRWRAGMTVKVAVTVLGLRERERRLIERLRPAHNREWNTERRKLDCRYTDWVPFGELR